MRAWLVMETKKSKYDTNPLDPDVERKAEESWGEGSGADAAGRRRHARSRKHRQRKRATECLLRSPDSTIRYSTARSAVPVSVCSSYLRAADSVSTAARMFINPDQHCSNVTTGCSVSAYLKIGR